MVLDTPLKIVKKLIERAAPGTQELTTLIELKDLLKSYGGKPLHLFPIKDLPGYVKEDVELENGNKTEIGENDGFGLNRPRCKYMT